VAVMLSPLEPAKAWEILQGLLEGSAFALLKNGDTQDKAGAEILDPGAKCGRK